MEWYVGYMECYVDDGIEGWLMLMYIFIEDWDLWEMYFKGVEVVLCVVGVMIIYQELFDGSNVMVVLVVGDYVINLFGVWYMADVVDSVIVVFVMVGWGMEYWG